MNDKVNERWEKINRISEEQKIQDREMILQSFIRGTSVELKTFANKRPHPFALENMQND